ncbi:5'/3'-nucleotidase SurE [Neorhodopirellula pilleata]|uniref:5'-nucleotidase n=1 Tax=Neorhodopirellula pilleata TaxID=2714738 RepID=A0A5C6ACZ7_9BACT|nr:5'/3'-nucleotidase SurE [Neorhodopirellula pilleata]TWT97287.1 5'-nucleotidase SurE [Neorhodopirellula pilleata]
MQFLITNDDGIDAPGISAMVETIGRYAHGRGWSTTKIWVVAPDRGRSECSHSVTTSRDLIIKRVKSGWYAVDGTPVDCVRVAIACLCPQVDYVFSGINAGANVGMDLLVSGTFAAAREASILGKPAMAVSHYRRPEIPKTWHHTPDWLTPTLDHFFASDLQSTIVWNVNLPALDPAGSERPKTIECPIDTTPIHRIGRLGDGNLPSVPITWLAGAQPQNEGAQTQNETGNDDAFEPPEQHCMPVQLTSDFHGRSRQSGSDVDLCFAGNLTFSRIHPFLQMG